MDSLASATPLPHTHSDPLSHTSTSPTHTLTHDNGHLYQNGAVPHHVNGNGNGIAGQLQFDFTNTRNPSEPLSNWIFEPETGDASYQIGRRYLHELNEHGQAIIRVVPLTLADYLHPLEGDEFVATGRHNALIKALDEAAQMLLLAGNEALGPLASALFRQGPLPQADPLPGILLEGILPQDDPLQGAPPQGIPLQGVPPRGTPLQGVLPQINPLQGVPVQGAPVQGALFQGIPLQGIRPLGVGLLPQNDPELATTAFLVDVDMDLGLEDDQLLRPDLTGVSGLRPETLEKIQILGIFRARLEPDIRLRFVFEAGSKTTEKVDLFEKAGIYDRAGFEQYLFAKPASYDENTDLLEFHNFVRMPNTGKLEKQPLNADGSVTIPFMRITIMPRLNADGMMDIRNMFTGEPVGNLKKQVRDKLAETQRADREQARADEAQQELANQQALANKAIADAEEAKRQAIADAEEAKRQAADAEEAKRQEKARADKAIADAKEAKRQEKARADKAIADAEEAKRQAIADSEEAKRQEKARADKAIADAEEAKRQALADAERQIEQLKLLLLQAQQNSAS